MRARFEHEFARERSLAGDQKDVLNRSYKTINVTASNTADLDVILEIKRLLKAKPVIVSLLLSNPTVEAEFEPAADAIVAHFGVQDQALLEIVSGAAIPQ